MANKTDGENATEKRKAEHIARALKDEANYDKSTLFEDVFLIHNALPEVDFESISTKTMFMGYEFKAPLIIEAMTGGYKAAKEINIGLASAAADKGIGLGLGSQRAMIEKPELSETYAVKKEVPDVFLIGNIGAYQLKEYPPEKIEEMISKTELDALAIHLNPLQELIQPEGDKNWEGVLAAIEKHADRIPVPIIFKEVGSGLSPKTILKLEKISTYFDIAGAGGTSWSRIEYMRGGSIEGFEEWGIPTALALLMAKHDYPDGHYIASGGIRSGIEGAKALALGAEMFGAAKPFLEAYTKSGGEKSVAELIDKWIEQLKGVMFLTGFNDVKKFKADARDLVLLKGKLRELYEEFLRL